jgi:hypothetical protein
VSARRRSSASLVLGGVIVQLALVAGCPAVGDAERLHLTGTLEREGAEGTDTSAVEVQYLSDTSRGEYWPCDLRLTALGCVGEHHVNVYVTMPQIVQVSDIGRAACVVDGVPSGVYEAFDTPGAELFTIGSDLNAYIIVASDVVEPSGAELTDDQETTAASKLATGTVNLVTFGGLDGNLRVVIDGETTEGNTVHVEFHGPMTNPGAIPLLESPSTCVESALVP